MNKLVIIDGPNGAGQDFLVEQLRANSGFAIYEPMEARKYEDIYTVHDWSKVYHVVELLYLLRNEKLPTIVWNQSYPSLYANNPVIDHTQNLRIIEDCLSRHFETKLILLNPDVNYLKSKNPTHQHAFVETQHNGFDKFYLTVTKLRDVFYIKNAVVPHNIAIIAQLYQWINRENGRRVI